MAIKIYLATKMTGRYAWELSKEMRTLKAEFASHGIEATHPWEWEHMFYKWNQKIHATSGNRAIFWERDKEAIRNAHVVLHVTGNRFSRGAECEMILQIGRLRRPGVWVDDVESIRCDEGYVVTTIAQAADLILRKWGTWPKRVLWRLIHNFSPRILFQDLVDELAGWR